MKYKLFYSTSILCLFILLSACGTAGGPGLLQTQEDGADAGPVQLVFYIMGNFPQPDQNEVFAAANRMIMEELDAAVAWRAVTAADYDRKISEVIAAGEEFDLCFTSHAVNHYFTNAAKGVFLPLDDLLAEYAPLTLTQVPKRFWDAVKIDGSVYAVVNERVAAVTAAISIPKTVYQNAGFDMGAEYILNDIGSLGPFFEAAYPGLPPQSYAVTGLSAEYLGYDCPAGMDVPGAVYVLGDAEEKYTVVNQFTHESFIKFISDMRYFAEMGWQGEPGRMDFEADNPADRTSGLQFITMDTAYAPGGEIFETGERGYEVLHWPAGKPILTTRGVTASMTAVSATSKNPEAAVALIELLNTSGGGFNKLYTTLAYGVEGGHWYIDDGCLVRTQTGLDDYTCGLEDTLACRFQAPPLPGQGADIWQVSREYNKSAVVSPLYGFVFDLDPIKAEAEGCRVIYGQFKRAIETGGLTVREYGNFITRLELAGAQLIIDEMQRQVDAWLAE